MGLRMKSKDIDSKKPWENISIDEIQPYPPKYNRLTILLYLAIFYTVFFYYFNSLNIFNSLMPILNFICYGIISFFVLNIIFDQWSKEDKIKLIGIFLFFYTILAVIVNGIILIKLDISLFKFLGSLTDISFLIGIILTYFNGFFILIIMGGILYLYNSKHPRVEKYGIVAIGILAIVFILKIAN